MHVSFEGPGIMADWIREKGHDLEYTRLYEDDPLPDPDTVDLLILMGGPMDVFDFHMHAWMQEEIDWVRDFIESGNPVLGICLGAQILAVALGEEVYPGQEKEIGWHTLQFLPSLGEFKIFRELPASRKVFHWHGDTFNIPGGATRIASTGLFPNQGFIFDRRVVALQFHLEVTLVQIVADKDDRQRGLHASGRKELAQRAGKTVPQVIVRFALKRRHGGLFTGRVFDRCQNARGKDSKVARQIQVSFANQTNGLRISDSHQGVLRARKQVPLVNAEGFD